MIHSEKLTCFIRKERDMIPKTIFKKDGQEVVLSECCLIVNGGLKSFCIEETAQFFSNEKRAIRAANDLLLKKTLSKFRYKEKKLEKRKRIGANKIARTHKCYKETSAFIKRWDGEIYLETKKLICKELKDKLDSLCMQYEFENVHAAIGFLERRNYNGNK